MFFPLRCRLLGCRVTTALAIILSLAPPAFAEDPPTRVGSLNYVSGEVSYALVSQRGEPGAADELSWVQADFDQPVCEDMSLRTGRMARARVRIGADAIEMSGDTVLNVLNLSERLIEASVREGRVYLQVDRLGDGESVEIEIPRGSLWLLQPGGYDVEVGTADRPARITVLEGKARFVGGSAVTALAAGEEVRITGTYPAVTTTARSAAETLPTAKANADDGAPPPPAPPSAAAPASPALGNDGHAEPVPAEPPDHAPAPAGSTRADMAPPPSQGDDFLYFVAESNGDSQANRSARHVSSATTGYDDLDRYGHWETLPDSEAVWFPSSVPADWAPYRYGHWDSISPWGWTWVDDEPWGFAPFHYGRWVNLDGHWGWVPGPVTPNPVYAPALVAFVDPNGDGGAAPDGPDVGWFPLGPGDPYAPWYVAGPAYVERVNVIARGPIGAVRESRWASAAWRAPFADRQFATAVPRSTFAGGRPVQQAMASIAPDRLAHAAVLHGAPRVVPAAARIVPNAEDRRGEPGRGGDRGGAAAARAPAAHAPAQLRGRATEPRAGGRSFAHPTEFRNGAEAFHGPQQIGHPQMFHNAAGVSPFGRQQGFQTPAARSFPIMGHAMPTFGGVRAAPMHFGGGGSIGRHK